MTASCPASNWTSLPYLVLIEIFTYLSPEDRISASSVCRSWRPPLFHARFWKRLRLDFTRHARQWERSEFLAARLPLRQLTSLTVSFHFDENCLDQTLHCLASAAASTRLRVLRLQPQECGPLVKKAADTKSVIIEAVQRLKEILTNAKQLELLDLGFMPDLIYVANKLDLFELLGRHSGASLRQLNLATIKERENAAGSRPVLSINPDLFYPLKKLRQLGLDYDYVDDDLLHALGHERRDDSLLHLHLFVQRVDGAHRGPTNGSWARFVQANPHCQLHLSVVCSNEAVTLLHSHILQPDMPLANLSTYFCEKVNDSALEILSQWYESTLRSIRIVDRLVLDAEQGVVGPANLLATSESLGRVDPFVLMAWKCRKLESITLIGYQYSDIGLIGIARLCGPKLRHLNIPDVCINYDAEAKVTTRFLSKAVGQALTRKWRPMKTDELDAAITDPGRRSAGWDAYVLTSVQHFAAGQ